MGGNTSDLIQTSAKDRTNFRFLRVHLDKRYGEVKLMIDTRTRKVAVAQECLSNTKEGLEKYIEQGQLRMGMKHEHLQPMLGYLKLIEGAFCGDIFKVVYLFEHFDEHFSTEMDRRRLSRTYFSEEELWIVLTACVEALSYLQEMDVAHEDICPENILIQRNANGKRILVGDPLLRYDGMSQFKQMYYKANPNRDSCYLSPILFSVLESGGNGLCHNKFKSDVFSLGMVLLEAATMNPIADCYDTYRKRINLDYFNKLLFRASSLFSASFSKILLLMLRLVESERPDFLSLRKRMQNEIRSIEKVRVDSGGFPSINKHIVTQTTSPSIHPTLNFSFRSREGELTAEKDKVRTYRIQALRLYSSDMIHRNPPLNDQLASPVKSLQNELRDLRGKPNLQKSSQLITRAVSFAHPEYLRQNLQSSIYEMGSKVNNALVRSTTLFPNS